MFPDRTSRTVDPVQIAKVGSSPCITSSIYVGSISSVLMDRHHVSSSPPSTNDASDKAVFGSSDLGDLVVFRGRCQHCTPYSSQTIEEESSSSRREERCHSLSDNGGGISIADGVLGSDSKKPSRDTHRPSSYAGQFAVLGEDIHGLSLIDAEGNLLVDESARSSSSDESFLPPNLPGSRSKATKLMEGAAANAWPLDYALDSLDATATDNVPLAYKRQSFAAGFDLLDRERPSVGQSRNVSKSPRGLDGSELHHELIQMWNRDRLKKRQRKVLREQRRAEGHGPHKAWNDAHVPLDANHAKLAAIFSHFLVSETTRFV